MLMCMESKLCCVVTAMQLLLSMVDTDSLVCRSCGLSQAVLSLYGMLECMLCSEIVLPLNVADILYAGRLVDE